MFPANNSFHRAAVLANPACMSRVKYAPIYAYIGERYSLSNEAKIYGLRGI